MAGDIPTEHAPLPSDRAAELLTHRRLLGARVYLHTYIRLAMVLVIILGGLIGRYVVGLDDLPLLQLAALSIVIATYNAVAWFSIRFSRSRGTDLERRPQLLWTLYLAVVADYLALTCAIWMLGGARSPFLPFYMLHAILSCVMLSKQKATLFASFAYLLLCAQVVNHWRGIVPPYDLPSVTGATGAPSGQYALTVMVVYGSFFGLATFLLITLSAALRQGERQLHDANTELDRLSNMRRDFLHIAMHNLRSPVGSVTMFLRNLRNGLAGPISDEQQSWVDRSLGKLDGLGAFLADLQTFAALESGRLSTTLVPVPIGPLLQQLVAEQADVAEQTRHVIRTEIADDLPAVLGVERLLREALVNYLTNAIKYTPPGSEIIVRAAMGENHVRVEVIDQGAGISEEDQQRLFGEFVRLGRSDKEIAKIPGSGLGLSIVKRVIEAMGGRVGVRSTVGAGSTFFVDLPIAD